MGGFGSKPVPPPAAPKIAFAPDYSRAQFSGEELQRQLAQSAAQATQFAQQQAETAKRVTTATLTGFYKPVVWILGLSIVAILLAFLIDFIAVKITGKELSGFGWLAPTSSTPVQTQSSTPVAAPPPTLASRMYNSIFGDSSGNLAPSYHDAASPAVVQGSRAPLSSDSQGGYGMQWWMFVKDWNYGYGKQKSVVKRPDTTNSSVMNPHISLHPTDNTLQVSVSVFPATEGGSSKATPAPAGHSGSTDDVFVCEVPNIPLQTWFSVSVTIFGRNLDVYIDGKLVKSCFLTGVPKPAVGDIQLTPDGGFSGRICDFYHYPRMLTPGDAETFYTTGTSCKSKTEPGVASKATGYSVKFGVYDSLGKEVQEYSF